MSNLDILFLRYTHMFEKLFDIYMSMTVLIVSEACHTLCFSTRIVGYFVFNFVKPVRILSDGQHLGTKLSSMI